MSCLHPGCRMRKAQTSLQGDLVRFLGCARIHNAVTSASTGRSKRATVQQDSILRTKHFGAAKDRHALIPCAKVGIRPTSLLQGKNVFVVKTRGSVGQFFNRLPNFCALLPGHQPVRDFSTFSELVNLVVAQLNTRVVVVMLRVNQKGSAYAVGHRQHITGE